MLVSGATYTSDAYAQSPRPHSTRPVSDERPVVGGLRWVERVMGTTVSIVVEPPLVPEEIIRRSSRTCATSMPASARADPTARSAG